MGRIVRNGISYGGTGTVDPILDLQSSNPVENKAVASAINQLSSQLNGVTIKPCTKEQYEAWKEAGTLDPNTLYFYPEVTS